MYIALKDATWQIDFGNIVTLVKGEPVNVPDEVAVMMIESGYIEIQKKEKEAKPVTENKELKPVTKNKKA